MVKVTVGMHRWHFREMGEERRVYAKQVEVGVEINAVRAFEDDIARRMRPVERRM